MADQGKEQDLGTSELQTLLLVGHAMNQEQDPEHICRWVADAVSSMLGASLAAVVLAPARHNSTRAVYGKVGDSPVTKPLVRDLSELAETEWPAPQNTGTVASLRKANLPSELIHEGINHLLRVPVRTIHQELGVLMVGMEGPWEPSSQGQFILTTLANQTAVALENARLRRETAERAERLAGFNRIISTITSSLDLEGIFRVLSSEVQHLLPHDRASVALADPGGQTATVHGAAGQIATLDVGTVVPIAGSNVGQVIKNGMGLFKTDIEQEKDFVEKPGLLALGIRSNVTVPLWEGDVCFGSLNFGSREVGKYGLDELILAGEIADHIAVAIINARLYKEKEAREQRLSRIYEHSNDAIFIIDPAHDEILDVNRAACEMIGYSREELLSMSVSSVHSLEKSKLRAFTQSVIEQGRGWTDELTCTTSAGEVIPVEISASTVDIEGTRSIIAIVRDNTERKQAEEALRELAVLEERNRIAREIHDSIAQGLTGIIWQLNVWERAVPSGGEQALHALERIRNLAKDCLQEARRSVGELRTNPLEGLSLVEALRREVEKITGDGRIKMSVSVSGEERVLPSGVETALLRICQESLANTLKHAKATEVTAALAYEDATVRLAVRDNGIGFDPYVVQTQRGRDAGGFGLISMRERTRLLGGELKAESYPGRGTLVEAILPV